MSRQTKRCIKFGSFVLLILYIAVLIYVCFLSEDYGRDGIYAFWIFYAHIKIEAQKMVLYVGHDIFTEFDD